MITLQSIADIPTKITLSLISGRSVKFSLGERGLSPDDFHFVETVQNTVSENSALVFSKSRASATFVPAEISNGPAVSLRVPHKRPLFLENLILIALFGKRPLSLKITADFAADFCPSLFRLQTEFLPLLRQFGAGGVQLEAAGGEVRLSVAVVASLAPVDLTAPGEIAKIRGLASGRQVPAAVASRLVYKAKGVFIGLTPDVWIASERAPELGGGSIKGYGLSLAAESTGGAFLTSDAVYEGEATPEEVADVCCARLLREIGRGGYVSRAFECVVLVAMGASREDISAARFGELNDRAKECLRDIQKFLGVVFKAVKDGQTVRLSCKGSGVINFSKKHF